MCKKYFFELRRAYRVQVRAALAEFRALDQFAPDENALRAGCRVSALVRGFASQLGCSARVAADCLGLE